MFESAVARWTGGEYDGEYRESWPAFRARCEAALRQVIDATPRDGTALVFTSGGTIAALCQGIMDLSHTAAFRLNWTLANAGVTKLRVGAGGVHLITLNEQSQFEGDHAALRPIFDRHGRRSGAAPACPARASLLDCAQPERGWRDACRSADGVEVETGANPRWS